MSGDARSTQLNADFMSALLIGYARVSTDAQDLTARRGALSRFGVTADADPARPVR